jgi:hypothetical protein
MDATLFNSESAAPATFTPDKGLEDHFSRLWEEVDSKVAADPPVVEPKPEAPAEPAATTESPAPAAPAKEEPKPEAPAPEVKAEPEAPKAKKKKLAERTVHDEFDRVGEHLEEPKAEPATPSADADIDALELHPSASAKAQSDFGKLKEIAKNFAAEAKQAKADLQAYKASMEAEIQPLRQAAQYATPEMQAEIESARKLKRELGIITNMEMWQPAQRKLDALVDDMYTTRNYPDYTEEYLRDVRDRIKKTGAWNLNFGKKEYWDGQFSGMTGANELTKDGYRLRTVDLAQEQAKVAKEVEDYAKDEPSFAKYQAQQEEKKMQFFGSELVDEVTKIYKERPELPRAIPLDGLTGEERTKAEQQNAIFEQQNKRFREVASSIAMSPNNARVAARMGLYVVEMENYVKSAAAKIEELEKQIASVPQLKAELVAKRKAADAPMSRGIAASTPATPEKPKLSEMAGRKGLDEAYRNWKL